MKPTESVWAVYDDGDGSISEVFHISGEDGARDYAAAVNDPKNGYRYVGKAAVVELVPADRVAKLEAAMLEPLLMVNQEHWSSADEALRECWRRHQTALSVDSVSEPPTKGERMREIVDALPEMPDPPQRPSDARTCMRGTVGCIVTHAAPAQVENNECVLGQQRTPESWMQPGPPSIVDALKSPPSKQRTGHPEVCPECGGSFAGYGRDWCKTHALPPEQRTPEAVNHLECPVACSLECDLENRAAPQRTTQARVPPMNRCPSRTYVSSGAPRQCTRLSCHTGECEFEPDPCTTKAAPAFEGAVDGLLEGDEVSPATVLRIRDALKRAYEMGRRCTDYPRSALDEANHEGWLTGMGLAAGIALGAGAEDTADRIADVVKHCPPGPHALQSGEIHPEAEKMPRARRLLLNVALELKGTGRDEEAHALRLVVESEAGWKCEAWKRGQPRSETAVPGETMNTERHGK